MKRKAETKKMRTNKSVLMSLVVPLIVSGLSWSIPCSENELDPTLNVPPDGQYLFEDVNALVGCDPPKSGQPSYSKILISKWKALGEFNIVSFDALNDSNQILMKVSYTTFGLSNGEIDMTEYILPSKPFKAK